MPNCGCARALTIGRQFDHGGPSAGVEQLGPAVRAQNDSVAAPGRELSAVISLQNRWATAGSAIHGHVDRVVDSAVFEARVVISDFKAEHNTRHRHSALGYRTPAEYAPVCRCTRTPVSCSIS